MNILGWGLGALISMIFAIIATIANNIGSAILLLGWATVATIMYAMYRVIEVIERK